MRKNPSIIISDVTKTRENGIRFINALITRQRKNDIGLSKTTKKKCPTLAYLHK